MESSMPKQKHISSNQIISRIALLVISAYIAAQMLSDIASVKIGVVAGLAVDMGTFIYPVTFTLRDLVHKTIGMRNTRILILVAGVINLLMAGYLMWVANVPGDPAWGLQEEFKAILGPIWRIVIASIAAEVISELVDTEVYHIFVKKVTTQYQWARVLTSNGLSVPVDNIIFAVGAFGWFLPWPVVWDIFVFNLMVKYGITILSLPLIYLAPDQTGVDV
jgi:uncharacterized integral membrane protein (TIGR00697 family)